MLFKEIHEKITSSKEYIDFIKENPNAELCAGFFILDFISNDTKRSLDFKAGDKIFTFDLKDDLRVKVIEDKLMDAPNSPPLLKIDHDIKVEIDELKGMAGIEALENGIHSKFNKIIAVLQKQLRDEKEMHIWNLTCMLDGLIILNILIDAMTGEIIKFERKSMMDLIKKK